MTCSHAYRIMHYDGTYVLREPGSPAVGLRAECVGCQRVVRIVIPRDDMKPVAAQIEHFIHGVP